MITMNIFFMFGSRNISTTVDLDLYPEEKFGIDDVIRLTRGEFENIEFPVVYKQNYGKQWRDMLETGWLNFWPVSDRMIQVLEENEITGWKTFPIIIYDKKGNKVDGYHGFSVIGRAGAVEWDKREPVKIKGVDKKTEFDYFKGFPIDMEPWDGSDIFIPGNDRAIITTERAAEIMNKAKLTNISFELTTEILIPKLD